MNIQLDQQKYHRMHHLFVHENKYVYWAILVPTHCAVI